MTFFVYLKICIKGDLSSFSYFHQLVLNVVVWTQPTLFRKPLDSCLQGVIWGRAVLSAGPVTVTLPWSSSLLAMVRGFCLSTVTLWFLGDEKKPRGNSLSLWDYSESLSVMRQFIGLKHSIYQAPCWTWLTESGTASGCQVREGFVWVGEEGFLCSSPISQDLIWMN